MDDEQQFESLKIHIPHEDQRIHASESISPDF
jgi:hypothetical protein